jgi:hypothetical protein
MVSRKVPFFSDLVKGIFRKKIPAKSEPKNVFQFPGITNISARKRPTFAPGRR